MAQRSEDGVSIVVGVDGSGSSKAAFRWAVRQARLTGARVKAVTVWQWPPYGWPPVPDDADLGSMAASMLSQVISEVNPPADVKVDPVVAQGNPARVLLDAACDAELLVVGSRGHSGFTEALLGSVGQRCVHHASCPVVIVRDDTRPGSDAQAEAPG